MSGSEKKRLQLDAWMERKLSNMGLTILDVELRELDKSLEKCEEILNRVNYTVKFGSKINKCDDLVEDAGHLIQYIEGLPLDLDNIIDSPLKKNFNINATESISRINADDISTDNTIGIMKPISGQITNQYKGTTYRDRKSVV